jgi:GAF domain-containing protein
MTRELTSVPDNSVQEPHRLFRGDNQTGTLAFSYQHAVYRAGFALSDMTNPDHALQEIVVAATRALDSDIGLVRRMSPDGQNLIITSATGPAPLSIGSLIGSYSVVAPELRSAKPNICQDIDLRNEARASILTSHERWEFEHIGGHHLLVVPLFAHDVLVGRIDLIRTADRPFTNETCELAVPFAAMAAAVLRTQQLQHASDERHVFQTVIRLHQSVEQLADPETILQAVVELIVREPGCARCYAMLWNPERAEFVPTAVAGLDPHLVDILKLITLSPQVVPAFDQMVHSSRPLLIADATKSTLLPASLVRALGIRAAMIVPLRGRRHQTTGVLLLDQSEEEVEFTDEQVSMMAGMAQHLSTIIENAILFEEIRTSSDSMSIINEIAIQLAMLTDEESLFRQLYHQVASVLDASRCGMALLSPNRRTLDLRVAVDGAILPVRKRVPIGDDPLSTVALSGHSELLGIRSGADVRDWLPDVHVEEPSHSHLTVPITVGRNVIGSLSIQSTFRNAYGPREKELLHAVALHTGIAIENARLYRIVRSRGDRRAAVLDQVMHRQELERKELVDDIHDDTLQTLAACLYRLDQARSTMTHMGPDEPAVAQIDGVRESLAENIDRLRRRIFELRPATLDRLGLAPALREHLSRFTREHGIATELDIDISRRLHPDDETLVYRLVQEAVEHISNRPNVSTLTIGIRELPGTIQLAIFDDGNHAHGGPQDDISDQLDVGMLALIERADLAGGHVRVSRRSAGGSLMQITLPARMRDSDNDPVTGGASDGDDASVPAVAREGVHSASIG